GLRGRRRGVTRPPGARRSRVGDACSARGEPRRDRGLRAPLTRGGAPAALPGVYDASQPVPRPPSDSRHTPRFRGRNRRKEATSMSTTREGRLPKAVLVGAVAAGLAAGGYGIA